MVNFEKVNANWDAGNNHKKLILIDLPSFYFFNNFFLIILWGVSSQCLCGFLWIQDLILLIQLEHLKTNMEKDSD